MWVEDITKVEHQGTQEYLEWSKDFVKEEYEIDDSSFPTLAKQVELFIWTRLPDKSAAKFFFKNGIHKNFAIYVNNISNAQVDKRLFLGHTKEDIDERLVFAVVNSVFTCLGMELIDRTNLGEGALDVNVVDYEKLPVVDPVILGEKLNENGKLQNFLQVIDQMLKMKPVDIESDARA